VVASLLDREALPWQADWYRSKVTEDRGDGVDDHFRLWYTDNALHGDDEIQESPTHSVSYLGVLHQALRDVSRWVEEDVAPPPSTSYEVVDGQVIVPPDATERRGVQPVVTLTVNGEARADVPVGEEVTLQCMAQVPDGAGVIVASEWDFEGSGRFSPADAAEPTVTVLAERRFSFGSPGTYFPTVRVASHRDGDGTSPYARLQNLARARVVVTDL
jgi:hypothetical protein